MKFVKIIRDTCILLLITVLLVTILSLVKVVTQPIINETNLAVKIKSYTEVCPGYVSSELVDKNIIDVPEKGNAKLYGDEPIIRCKNSDDGLGETIGYIVNCTAKGYGGQINLIVGFDIKGNIVGIRYANVPSETPGIGMKTTEQNFLDKWINYNSENVEEVDTISGATISSSAFKEAVTLACEYVAKIVSIDGGI